ncbi:MAG: hypothetical protein WCJ14_05455 [Verrucomicrobiota bacterium]
MKASLYILAILAAGGGLFFTSLQSDKFNEAQNERIKVREETKTVSANAAVKETELTHEKAIIAAADLKREEIAQSVASIEASGATLKRDSIDLDNTLKAQDQEFADIEKSLAEVNKIVASLGGGVTLDNLADKIQEIDADKKTKQTKLEEGETLMAAAEKSLANSRADADRFAKRIVERNAHIARNAMEAVITAVDQEWGFLVIGAGSNSGFTQQTNLLVQRDGHLIGHVRPSSIELNQTIAEIDFKSLSPGVRIQAGDRVILNTPNTN